MLNFRNLTVLTASIALTASPLWAVDTINVRSTGKPVQGEITTANKTEVTIKPRTGDPQKIPANDIVSIKGSSKAEPIRRAAAPSPPSRIPRCP